MTEKKPKSERSRDERASQLKESLYLTFAALAVSLALTGHKEVTAAEASLTLGVTLLGTVLAVFTADVIAHLVSHERLMSIVEFRHAVRSSFRNLSTELGQLLSWIVEFVGSVGCSCGRGRLIHADAGISSGTGGRRTNRSGWAA